MNRKPKSKITKLIKESLSKVILDDYFSDFKHKKLNSFDEQIELLLSRNVNAAYKLIYKKNIYKANLKIIDTLFNKYLSETDKSILRMKHKRKLSFLTISMRLELNLNHVYFRYKQIINLIYILVTGMISENSKIYFFSPQLLALTEERLSIEYSYVLLGLNSDKKIMNKIDASYIKVLYYRKQKITILRQSVIMYLANLRNSHEVNIIKECLSNIYIHQTDLSLKYYLSIGRITQILKDFKVYVINVLKDL